MTLELLIDLYAYGRVLKKGALVRFTPTEADRCLRFGWARKVER